MKEKIVIFTFVLCILILSIVRNRRIKTAGNPNKLRKGLILSTNSYRFIKLLVLRIRRRNINQCSTKFSKFGIYLMTDVLTVFYLRHILPCFVLHLMLFVQYSNVRGSTQFVPSFSEWQSKQLSHCALSDTASLGYNDDEYSE